jgi:putative ABC transport system permease protein
MKSKDLGFDKAQTYVIEVPQSNDSLVGVRALAFRNELTKMPGVAGASFSDNVPGGRYGELYFYVQQDGGRVNKFLGFTWMDEHYLAQMKIPVVTGRNFSREIQTDEKEGFIINQACARFLGWTDPIGKEMENGFGLKGRVVGMVRDYHVSSLHTAIKPLVMMYTRRAARNLLVKLQAGADIRKTVAGIDAAWKNFDPTHPMESFFLDESFDKNYDKEDKMLKVFGYFSLLAILISCLGLFGLASYTTEQRTKEIGVRKVLGASAVSIATMITRDFVVLVLVAVGLSLPVAWMLLSRWLEDFAFRIDLSWIYFAAGSLAGLAVAILTVSLIALRAASRNPVLSLRYE